MFEVATTKKQKREYRFNAHGITLQDYVASPKVELWLKVLAYIMHWYLNPKHENKVFYQKYSTIRKIFYSWGYECTDRGIEEAFRILKTPQDEGGVELIKVEYADTTKSSWREAGENPNRWIYRKVRLNWARVKKYVSVFSGESKVLKTLPSKHRLKKLIYKRFMSYTWTLQAIFDKQMKEAKIEKYTTANKMFYGFIYTYSRKFYDPLKLIKNFIPEHTINLQKEQDAEAYQEALALVVGRPPTKPQSSQGQASQEARTSQRSIVNNFIERIL